MKSIIQKKLKNLSNKTANSTKSIVGNSTKKIRTYSGINEDLLEKMVQLVKFILIKSARCNWTQKQFTRNGRNK